MLYDLSNELQCRNFRLRAESLTKRGGVVELKERKPRRSDSQNRYLHVCLGYFASEIGLDERYVKEKYFKELCNRELFVREKEDKYRGRVEYLRSSADLDTAEMTTAIERFRNWAAAEPGIYIPSPDEDRLIQLMELEMERNKNYI